MVGASWAPLATSMTLIEVALMSYSFCLIPRYCRLHRAFQYELLFCSLLLSTWKICHIFFTAIDHALTKSLLICSHGA